MIVGAFFLLVGASMAMTMMQYFHVLIIFDNTAEGKEPPLCDCCLFYLVQQSPSCEEAPTKVQ
jgi:hypothetical protein